MFFRQLESQTDNNCPGAALNHADFRYYWKSVWCGDKHFNGEAQWICKTAEKYSDLPEVPHTGFTEKDVTGTVKRTSNWKSSGPDGIQNFWIKYLSATYGPPARSFTARLKDPNRSPDRLTEGITHSLHKKCEINDPQNYRPITCLSVFYKLLTSVIFDKS